MCDETGWRDRGAFYKHFKSRDRLVVEALGTAFKDLDAWEEHGETLAQCWRTTSPKLTVITLEQVVPWERC